jgi:hypothetical protein
LAQFVAEHGGDWGKVSAADWAQWDRMNLEYQSHRRSTLPLPAAKPTRPTGACAKCGATGDGVHRYFVENRWVVLCSRHRPKDATGGAI